VWDIGAAPYASATPPPAADTTPPAPPIGLAIR
jgi:hypothetical protein